MTIVWPNTWYFPLELILTLFIGATVIGLGIIFCIRVYDYLSDECFLEKLLFSIWAFVSGKIRKAEENWRKANCLISEYEEKHKKINKVIEKEANNISRRKISNALFRIECLFYYDGMGNKNVLNILSIANLKELLEKGECEIQLPSAIREWRAREYNYITVRVIDFKKEGE